MKKRIALLMAGVMSCMPATVTLAEDVIVEEDVLNYQITDTMTVYAGGQKVTITVEADWFDTLIGNVNVTVGTKMNGINMSVSLKDIIRVLPDAVYVNVGDITNLIGNLTEETDDIEETLEFLGIDAQWIAIYKRDFPVLPDEQLATWNENFSEYLEGAFASGITETDTGWKLEFLGNEIAKTAKTLYTDAEDSLTDWTKQWIEIVQNVDWNPFIKSYLTEGVKAIAEEPLYEDFMEVISVLPELLNETLGSIDDAMLTELLEEEGISYEALLDEMEYMGFELLSVTGSLEEQENRDQAGTFLITGMVEEEGFVIKNELFMEYGSAQRVLAPKKSQDAKSIFAELCKENAQELQELFYLSGLMPEETIFETEEETTIEETSEEETTSPLTTAAETEVEETSVVETEEETTVTETMVEETVIEETTEAASTYAWDDTLVLDGNRVLLKDIWNEAAAWLTFDDTQFTMDEEFSSGSFVFLDKADGSDYIGLGISGVQSFEEYCNNMMEYGYSDEYYQDVVFGTINTSGEGVTPIQFTVISYTMDQTAYKDVIFGVDIPDGGCIYGQYTLSPYGYESEVDLLYDLHFVFQNVTQ